MQALRAGLRVSPRRTSPLVALVSRGAASDAAKEKAEQAKETASQAADKAKAVASDASARASQAASAAGARLSSAGSALGRYTSAVVPPLTHGLAVTREVAKQVYIAEKLAPPAPSEFQPVWQDIYQKATSHEWWESTTKDSAKWGPIALIALEAYFLFKIGEMIGRRRIQGCAFPLFPSRTLGSPYRLIRQITSRLGVMDRTGISIHRSLCSFSPLKNWGHPMFALQREFMQTEDEDHLFQTDDATARSERRREKQAAHSTEGEPLVLGSGSKPLDVLIRGNEAWIAENGFVARRIDLSSSSTARTRALFKGHRGPVCALALHRLVDGQLLLFTGSWDKSIRVWDAKGADLLSVIEDAHADFVKSLSVVPELDVLVSGGSDKAVRLWDLAPLASTSAPQSLALLRAHTRPIERLAYHRVADSTDCAVWSADSMGKICIWRLSPSSEDASRVRAEMACEWRDHETAVYDLVVDAERGHVWTGSADKSALLSSFDPAKPEQSPVPLLRIEHPYYVRTLLPWDDYLITGSTDEGIRLWDVSALRRAPSVAPATTTRTQAAVGWKEAPKIANATDEQDRDRGLIRLIDVHSHEVNRIVLWTRVTAQHDIEPWIVSASLDGSLRRWRLADLLKPPPAVAAQEVDPPAESTGMTAEEEAELEALLE